MGQVLSRSQNRVSVQFCGESGIPGREKPPYPESQILMSFDSLGQFQGLFIQPHDQNKAEVLAVAADQMNPFSQQEPKKNHQDQIEESKR
jgi:hypothetical protein